MKQLPVILSVVLLVAVSYLYYLQFAGTGAAATADTATGSDLAIPTEVNIAYINADSLQAKYQFIIDKSAELETKKLSMEAEYRGKVQNLQKEVESLRQNIGNMTPNRARAYQEELQQKEQNLLVYRDKLGNDLLTQESKISQELTDRVTEFLKDFSSRNNIQLVMYYSQGSGILYAHDGLDITTNVLDELNGIYNAEKNGTSAGAGTEAKAEGADDQQDTTATDQ